MHYLCGNPPIRGNLRAVSLPEDVLGARCSFMLNVGSTFNTLLGVCHIMPPLPPYTASSKDDNRGLCGYSWRNLLFTCLSNHSLVPWCGAAMSVYVVGLQHAYAPIRCLVEKRDSHDECVSTVNLPLTFYGSLLICAAVRLFPGPFMSVFAFGNYWLAC